MKNAMRLNLKNSLFAVTRPWEKKQGRSVGKKFFFTKIHIYMVSSNFPQSIAILTRQVLFLSRFYKEKEQKQNEVLQKIQDEA